MVLNQIMKGMFLDLIQNNICEYLYWNEKRKKYYCDSIKQFIHPSKLCPVYMCIACKKVNNCDNAPCDEYCDMGARSSP